MASDLKLARARVEAALFQRNDLTADDIERMSGDLDDFERKVRADGEAEAKAEAAPLDVVEAYEKGRAEGWTDGYGACAEEQAKGRAAAANDRSSERSEANTCATCQFLYPLVVAADRMRDRWAEADDAVRRELWQDLHTAAQLAGEHIYPLEPRAEAGSTEGEG